MCNIKNFFIILETSVKIVNGLLYKQISFFDLYCEFSKIKKTIQKKKIGIIKNFYISLKHLEFYSIYVYIIPNSIN